MSHTILASAEFFIRWQSTDTRHTDHEYFPAVDFGRDIFPADLGERMQAAGPGASRELAMAAGEQHIPGVTADNLRDLPRRGLDLAFATRHLPGPFRGRFYPRGWLSNDTAIGAIFKGDMQPFRVVGLGDERIQVDLNHPLGAYPLTVGGNICQILAGREQFVGRCNDIVADIARQGPGMQCRPLEGGSIYILSDFFHPLPGFRTGGCFDGFRFLPDTAAGAAHRCPGTRHHQPPLSAFDPAGRHGT